MFFQVIAKDLDEGLHGQVTYFIETQNEEATFRIDPKSGVIYAVRDLDPNQIYKLTVSFIDSSSSSCIGAINK